MEAFNIYKDPITDSGTKKSLKGLLKVYYEQGMKEDEWVLKVQQECTPEEESQGRLEVIYEDGKFYNETTLEQIRERLLNL